MVAVSLKKIFFKQKTAYEIRLSLVGSEMCIRDRYQDGKISVAADQLGSVNRYRSSGKIKPKINKLGGTEWERIKDKNKKQIKKVAVDILKLYAKREKLKGYIYPEDGPWQDLSLIHI